MKNIYPICLLLLCFQMQAQMNINGTIRYGNEWIQYDQPYFKIPITQDGIYRISYETLVAAGIPVNTTDVAQYQIFHLGEAIPIFLNKEGTLSNGDYIEFYGKKNRGELDEFMYKNGKSEMLNPEYSLITDTAIYYLTLAVPSTQIARYQNVTNNLNNLPAPEPWCWREELQVYNNGISYPVYGKINESAYVNGQGYGQELGIGTKLAISFSPKHYYNNEKSYLEVNLATVSTSYHRILINWKDSSRVETINGAKRWLYTAERSPWKSTDVLEIIDSTARLAVGYAKLKYPAAFNFDNQSVVTFEMPASTTAQYLEIENFNGGNAPTLYDLTNNLRIQPTVEGSKLKVKIPASTLERTILLFNTQNSFSNINNLDKIAFKDLQNNNTDYLILTSKRLRNTGTDEVQNYANYRASAAGGNFNTQIVEVEDLYEQFAYGIQRHPMSIRNFINYYKKQNPKLRYVFIIGKGKIATDLRSEGAVSSSPFYVPTWGAPGADNLLAASNISQVPIVPIGRLAALDPTQIKDYLDKVQLYENPTSQAADARAWRKEIIHLGGGGDANEQSRLRNYLTQLELKAKQVSLGANVTAFYKTSQEPIQQLSSTLLTNRINDGVSIITFFGHSSATGFDVSIDEPSTFQNYGKYHIVFSLGCHNGDLHLTPSGIAKLSASEKFVLQKDKGAIAFLATTGLGEISSLNAMQQDFYEKMANTMYGKSLGDILQSSLRQLDGISNITYRALVQQFSIHGDPALIPTPLDKPDYLIDAKSVKTEPVQIAAQQDSFTLRFDLLNIGKANTGDTLTLKITRSFPNGNTGEAGMIKVAAPLYKSTVSLRLPVLGQGATGYNKIFIQLNSDGKILEAPLPDAMTNNALTNVSGELGFEFYIFANNIIPLYPPDFGIVNKPQVKLLATTSDVNAPIQKYVIEIDTTTNFDHSFQKEVTQPGGVIEWTPNISLQDSTVYYWRIRTDSITQLHSFTYIKDSPSGWSQSHFYQMQQNRLFNMQLPERNRRWKFIEDVKEINIKNNIYKSGTSDWPSANIDKSEIIYQAFQNTIVGGIYVFVLDGATGRPWENTPNGLYGSTIEWGTLAFPFATQTPEQRAKAVKFLNEVVPADSYVIIYSLQRDTFDYEPQEWNSDSGLNLLQVFKQQGAKLIENIANTGAKPYVFVYKKDDPTFQPIEKAVENGETLNEQVLLYGNWFQGSVLTTVIGPARRWVSLSNHYSANDEYDEINLKLYGLRSDSSSVLLRENITPGDLDLSWIDSTAYPLLRLEFESKDETSRTTAQLDYWRVLYEGLPEVALNPNAFIELKSDTLQQGQPLSFAVNVANISQYDITDSLSVRYIITDEQNKAWEFPQTLPPMLHQTNQIAHFSLSDTKNLSGTYRLTVIINPDHSPKEVTYINNIGFFNFYVIKDQRNPLLDVTFDGMHIMNGDIISPRPYITMNLRDENRFLYLKDPAAIKVFLQKPDEAEQNIIPIDNDLLKFYPATEGEKSNTAKLEWTPAFLSDGLYTLTIQAQDATGNASGNLNYKISFNIITASQISNILNYPNPFSTSTHFVYTLTGEEPPADFKIQIMTVSGRIVRELTQSDLGTLRIGTHQTEHPWDGTDEYGNRLANGVYLYRVMAKDKGGKDMDKYENGTERFFKKNIGKLVILR